MRRYQINAMQAKQVMETCNPLGLIDCNKRLVVYGSPVECYEKWLDKVYKHAVRGWVDIPLLMQKLQGISLADAEDMCGYKRYAVVQWDCGNSVDARWQRAEKLKGILHRMLKVTGCDISEDALTKALFEFDSTLEQQKYYVRDFKVETTNIKWI